MDRVAGHSSTETSSVFGRRAIGGCWRPTSNTPSPPIGTDYDPGPAEGMTPPGFHVVHQERKDWF
jgi:hypothetical protein